jgi:hypothetical protein
VTARLSPAQQRVVDKLKDGHALVLDSCQAHDHQLPPGPWHHRESQAGYMARDVAIGRVGMVGGHRMSAGQIPVCEAGAGEGPALQQAGNAKPAASSR